MATKLTTIRVREYLVTQPRPKRARKAANYIRERIAHYSKLNVDDVKISPELNTLIIKRYAKHMVPVKVNISIDKGKATVTPVAATQPSAPSEQKAPATGKQKQQPEKKATKQGRPEKQAKQQRPAATASQK